MRRTLAQVVGAILLTTVLALGSTVAPAPAGADPADTYWPSGQTSHQYNLGGCLYKVLWGNFFTSPIMVVYFYNLSSCGGAVALIEYVDGGTVKVAHSTTVTASGTDGCGAYQAIGVGATSGVARRALVWVGTGARWYANDGLVAQPIHSFC